jgi:hypothetical protein
MRFERRSLRRFQRGPWRHHHADDVPPLLDRVLSNRSGNMTLGAAGRTDLPPRSECLNIGTVRWAHPGYGLRAREGILRAGFAAAEGESGEGAEPE